MQTAASRVRDVANSFGLLLERLINAKNTSVYSLVGKLAESEDQWQSWRTRLRRYLNGSWIPSPEAVEKLAVNLGVSRAVLLVAARHFHAVLGYLSAACLKSAPSSWSFAISPRVAALERLFTLFPLTERTDPSAGFHDDALMDPRLVKIASLARILETLGRENFMDEEDPVRRLWPYTVWALPAIVEWKHLTSEDRVSIVRHHGSPSIPPGSEFSDFATKAMALEMGYDSLFRSQQIKYQTLQAEHSINLADDISSALFGNFSPIDVRKVPPLSDALRILTNTSLNWQERCAGATVHVHAWADRLEGAGEQDADRVRRLLYPFKFKKLDKSQYDSFVRSIALR